MSAVLDPVDRTARRERRSFARRINKRWQDSVAAILEVGGLLVEAKAALPHGQFERMVDEDLPFGPRSARYLMRIPASDFIVDQVANRNHGAVLPADWRTLSEIAALPAGEAEALLAGGVINPGMQRNDVTAHLKLLKRREKHEGLAEASARARDEIGRTLYGVGVFDPPWRTEARSEKGLCKAADNHYPTMTAEEVAVLPVPTMFLDHAILFLWATMPLLDRQIWCLQQWGFRYVSHWVWHKVGFLGPGYWGREKHELLLIGRKGDALGPPPESRRRPSVIEAPFEGHSVKPAEVYHYIADEYESVPLVEGFGRKGFPKDSRFDVWGNEA